MATSPAERAIAQQRRRRDGQPAPPPPPPDQGATVAAAVAGLAAIGVASAAPAPPVVGAALTATAIAAAAGSVLAAFDTFQRDRLNRIRGDVDDALRRERPSIAGELLDEAVALEVEREREFLAKARMRLARDLPEALAIADPVKREERVRALLARERRFAEQRDEAIVERMRGLADSLAVEEASPAGGFWRLGRNENHCERCVALAERVWPWSVLRLFRPPLHPNCGCRIWTAAEAIRMGWWDAARPIASYDEVIRLMPILRESVDELGAAAWQDALERAFRETHEVRAGALRLKESLDASAAEATRLRESAWAESVIELGDALDVVAMQVTELAPRDRVRVDGQLDEVLEVLAPGVVRFNVHGLSHIPRATVLGIPAPPVEAAPLLVSFDIAMAIATTDRPDEETVLHVSTGIRFSPSLHRTGREGDALVIGEDFYAWDRARRAAVVFGHLGELLADRLGLAGAERGRVIRAYLALTTGRYETPDAVTRREVEDAAVRYGLPLREDPAVRAWLRQEARS